MADPRSMAGDLRAQCLDARSDGGHLRFRLREIDLEDLRLNVLLILRDLRLGRDVLRVVLDLRRQEADPRGAFRELALRGGEEGLQVVETVPHSGALLGGERVDALTAVEFFQ